MAQDGSQWDQRAVYGQLPLQHQAGRDDFLCRTWVLSMLSMAINCPDDPDWGMVIHPFSPIFRGMALWWDDRKPRKPRKPPGSWLRMAWLSARRKGWLVRRDFLPKTRVKWHEMMIISYHLISSMNHMCRFLVVSMEDSSCSQLIGPPGAFRIAGRDHAFPLARAQEPGCQA